MDTHLEMGGKDSEAILVLVPTDLEESILSQTMTSSSSKKKPIVLGMWWERRWEGFSTSYHLHLDSFFSTKKSKKLLGKWLINKI